MSVLVDFLMAFIPGFLLGGVFFYKLGGDYVREQAVTLGFGKWVTKKNTEGDNEPQEFEWNERAEK